MRDSGTVVFWPTGHRYGFARLDVVSEDRKDIFLHMNDLDTDANGRPIKVRRGDRVSFTIEETSRGPCGRRIVVLD